MILLHNIAYVFVNKYAPVEKYITLIDNYHEKYIRNKVSFLRTKLFLKIGSPLLLRYFFTENMFILSLFTLGYFTTSVIMMNIMLHKEKKEFKNGTGILRERKDCNATKLEDKFIEIIDKVKKIITLEVVTVDDIKKAIKHYK